MTRPNRLRLNLPKRAETQRLYLRPYRPGDGPMLLRAGARNRDHLERFESKNVLRHLTGEDHAETVAQGLSNDWAVGKHFFWGIFEKETDRWAGQVFVGPTDWDLPEFTIGYIADLEFEGKGFISEAVGSILEISFHDLGALRVRSDCNEENIRSWRLLERCGFSREGHLRANKRNPDGSYHGDFLYALLREEFHARKQSKA